MNKIKKMATEVGQYRYGIIKTALLLTMATLLNGCFLTASQNDYARDDGTVPWWCRGTPDLTAEECKALSFQFDIAYHLAAQPYPTLATVPGATAIPNTPSGIGYAVPQPGAPSSFLAQYPNVLLYAGDSADSQLAGVAWRIIGAQPEGFPGARDVWIEVTPGVWWLTAWIVRGYENHPNVFAASHPCLATGVTLSSSTDACFVASHTEPFEVLVSNDDGYSAAGIDAVVEGIRGLPNSTIHVVAPLTNQSGGGGNTTAAPYVVSGSPVTTISGRAATAVISNDPARQPAPISGSAWPADAVNYALKTMLLSPELVVTGINQGQNMGSVTPLSGTVGAARAARKLGFPAIASSQGGISPPNDFPTGVTATLALIEEWRLGRTVNTTNSVLNINIPTCAVGSVRGTVQTVVATNSNNYTLQDCSSIAPANSVISDIDAFNKGFIGIADVGVTKPPNWP